MTAAGTDEGRWYLAYCQLHREALAERELQNQGFQTFLPRYRKTVRHARKFREVIAPYFPRYLFVALPDGGGRWRSINGTRGVVRLVQFGDAPAPVPEGVVEPLRAQLGPTGLLETGDGLTPGDEVRLVSGPFAGFVGRLLSIGADARVRLLLEIMGTERQLKVPRSGIAPAT